MWKGTGVSDFWFEFHIHFHTWGENECRATLVDATFSIRILFPYDSLAPIINTRGPQTVCMDLSRTRDPFTHRFAPPTTRIGSQRDDGTSPLS